VTEEVCLLHEAALGFGNDGRWNRIPGPHPPLSSMFNLLHRTGPGHGDEFGGDFAFTVEASGETKTVLIQLKKVYPKGNVNLVTRQVLAAKNYFNDSFVMAAHTIPTAAAMGFVTNSALRVEAKTQKCHPS
jgi:hypothetical protein